MNCLLCCDKKTFTIYVCKALCFVTVYLVIAVLNVVYKNMAYFIHGRTMNILFSSDLFHLYTQILER